MTRSTPNLSGSARDEAIDRLYDVALDPARYESLVDTWEAVLKPLRDASDFGAPRLLDDPAISAHFRRAEAVLDRTDSTGTAAQMAQALAPFEMVAAFLLDAANRVAAANAAAQAMLDLKPGVPLAAMAVNAEDIDGIAAAARSLLAGAADDAADDAAVLRVRSRRKGHFVVLRLQPVTLGDGTRHILAATSEVICPDGFGEILRSAFDLTAAEASVVQGLVECCSVREIAEQRKRSVDTVRAQIKSILSKTETRSQVELVRLALSVMDMSPLAQDSSVAPRIVSRGYATLAERPFETLATPDGRRLDYLVLGARTGEPVLYLPTDYGFVRWPASAERAADARGLRIIVPVRAGYGMSDMVAAGTDYFEAFYTDIAQILAAEGVERCPLVSVGDDCYAAVQLANRMPGRFTALICCAGVLPLTRREQFERMEKWHRFILAGAKYTPNLLPFMVKAGFHLARRIGKRGFVHAVYGTSQADIDTFEEAEVFEAMVTGSEVALTEGRSAHAAFSRMLIGEKIGDWSASVHALRGKLPVILMNGAHDPQVPMATLDEFRADFDWIDYRVYNDTGQLVFFRHWRDVLDEIEKHIAFGAHTQTGV